MKVISYNCMMLAGILAHIKKNQIYSFAELLDNCCADNSDWLEFICGSETYAYVICEYIKSFAKESEFERNKVI